ncbi:unnamed protein product [Ostreobium quekettii]|uniref:Vacuolar protein sorting-associated protein 54 n=1 Tax=Ostreobium quekettii TaxID=121088 RepID=A0A8S1J488_9CHLO|nr:unnamed protein product [Ostreobium quekettii]|eukprot:evm.model.scf_398.4 EVM.evm.TU.scf_398.4   scf_398:20349-28502(+)
MAGQSVNTYDQQSPKASAQDGQLYSAGQGLAPVVNNPGPVSPLSIMCWPAALDRSWQEAPPPASPGLLREVTWGDFDEYLQRLSELHLSFNQARQQLEADSVRRIIARDPIGTGHLRGEGLLQALRKVPGLYFQEAFSLTRQEVFEEVCHGGAEEEWCQTVETLSGYMDTIEGELLNEIAARSDSFFEAAESLQALQQSLEVNLQHIKELEGRVAGLDKIMCKKAAAVRRLHVHRGNLKEVAEIVQVLEAVLHAQDAIQLLVLGKDYSSAVELLGNLKYQCEQQGLTRLHCLRHLPDSLANLSNSLITALEEDFEATTNWKSSVVLVGEAVQIATNERGSGPLDIDLEPSSSGRSVSSLEGDEELCSFLQSVLGGLSQLGALSGTLSRYAAKAAGELKAAFLNVMEQILTPPAEKVPDSPVDEQDSSRSSTEWRKAMQACDHAVFHGLLTACLYVAEGCCHHHVSVCELLGRLTSGARIAGHKAMVDLLMTEVCEALVEVLHKHFADMLNARSTEVSSLAMSQLEQLVRVAQKSIDLGKKYDVRLAPRLNNVVQGQCRVFLETIHTKNVSRLRELLDMENWKKYEAPARCQDIVNSLLPAERSAEVGENGRIETSSEPSTSAPSVHSLPAIAVGKQEYRIVFSAAGLIECLGEYLAFHKAFPEFVTETGQFVLELLTSFNTRSCQLLLGAQAMRTSGLKSITAKHLALCSQCIYLLRSLHRPLAAALLGSEGQSRRAILQPDFDRLNQDLITHCDSIHSKLVSIMKERLILSTRQLASSAKEWPHKDDATEPSNIALQIGKQLSTLSQVLVPLLLEEQIIDVFTRVAETFSSVLAESFQSLEPDQEFTEDQAEHWHHQWRTDTVYLLGCLRQMPLPDDVKEGSLKELSYLCSETVGNEVHGVQVAQKGTGAGS